MESTFEDKRLRYIVGLDYGTTYSGGIFSSYTFPLLPFPPRNLDYLFSHF